MGAGADPGAPFLRGRAEADPLQMAHAVRREIDAGADLAELRRLLVDRDVEAVRDQRVGGEQAADAAADDGDMGFRIGHRHTLYRLTPRRRTYSSSCRGPRPRSPSRRRR